MGLPRDASEWLALAMAVLVSLLAGRLASRAGKARAWVAGAAMVAAALSAAYVVLYLRGGPRIIDATSYWLEARAFAAGGLGRWALPEPEAATMGRFLLRTQIDGQPAVAPIFPPGWPALLALGFLARAPMAVGPLLAAALCVPTWAMARRAARALVAAGVLPEARAVLIAPVAVSLSVVCAALRYHTADTMAHGLAALCWSGSVASAWACLDPGLDRTRRLACAAVSGLAAGWLCATRPTSALALAAFAAVVLLAQPAPRRRGSLVPLAVALAAAVPGLLLLLVHQRALGGNFGGSSQLAYYAVADGPRGCFRYGFGAGIGCLGEHGDFVRARLGDGFGALAAAGTTLRRLKQHLIDAGNLEPLALLVPLAVALGWRARALRWLGLAVALQIAVYVPFYFDGNYPGGGARFFADVLPIEHVLLACAAACLAERARARAGAPLWLVAAALLGFAVRAGRDHAALRDREGGRPMFEPAVAAGLAPGAMLFVDTDHGFALAARPGAPHAVARRRGDAIDFLAWDAAGRPPAFAYHYDPGATVAAASILPIDFDAGVTGRFPSPGVIEGESLWPPNRQYLGWARPAHAAGTCASAGRWLELVPEEVTGPAASSAYDYPVRPGHDTVLPDDPIAARVILELPLPGPWLHGSRVAPVVAIEGRAVAQLVMVADGKPVGFVHDVSGSADARCIRSQAIEIPKNYENLAIRVSAFLRDRTARVALDALIVEAFSAPEPAGDPTKSR